MAEVLFVLVTVYGVYVIHSVFASKENKKRTPLKAQASFLKTEIKKAASKIDVKPSDKSRPVVAKKPTIKTKIKTELPAGTIRHPETGEVVKMASSYRMTKRWVKEALVTEGMLEKIYKTNEIDDDVQSKISKALGRLKAMDKYQGK